MVFKLSLTLFKWSKYTKQTDRSCCLEYCTKMTTGFSLGIMNPGRNVIPLENIKIRPLVVLLENCLTDVPKNNAMSSKSCEVDTFLTTEQQSLPKALVTTTNMDEDPFINLSNNVPSSETTSYANEDYVSSSDPIEQTTQTLSFSESLLLHLPISCRFDNDQVEKSGMVEDECGLCWEKLAGPQVCDVKTPNTSGSSSVVDLELTPPSSVTSRRSLFQEESSKSFTLDFDTLFGETDKGLADRQVFPGNCTKRELCIEITPFEPTLHQLQVLYQRNKSSKEATQNFCRSPCLRPRSSLKQFVPFMYEMAENAKNSKSNRGQKNKTKSSQSSRAFHSTPKSNHEKKKIKATLKQKNPSERKQLKLALKQKETSEKKQLKLALKKKKEALKYRNKYENALDSINRRIYNQNTFWRMLPR